MGISVNRVNRVRGELRNAIRSAVRKFEDEGASSKIHKVSNKKYESDSDDAAGLFKSKYSKKHTDVSLKRVTSDLLTRGDESRLGNGGRGSSVRGNGSGSVRGANTDNAKLPSLFRGR